MSERHTACLKRLVQAPEILVAPGVVDGIGARLVAKAGFDAIYMTGAGTTASRLGMPDVGLLTMTEMADNAGRIADASGLPLVADADTGYGGPVNVRRTVQAYERAGVAGLHIEDQGWPKRCGHLAGKSVIPTAEMVAKIKAACDARIDPDFQIIARCDAIAVEGWEPAIERVEAYEEAGADILFVEAMTTMEQLAFAPKHFGVPCLFNMAGSGKTPDLSAAEMEALGFGIAIFPGITMSAAVPAMTRALGMLKETGDVRPMRNEFIPFREYFDLMGMAEVQALEDRYAVDETTRVGY